MKARPRPKVGGISGAVSVFGFTGRNASATSPIDAVMALAAFGANQALTAHIDFAHSVSRAMQGQAALVSAAGERTLAPGPVRAAVRGAAELQAEWARDIAGAAQAMGRKYGHLAFAFPSSPR